MMDYYCVNCDIIVCKDGVFSDWYLDPYVEEVIVVDRCPKCLDKVEKAWVQPASDFIN